MTPHSVQIQINNMPLTIETGKAYDIPLIRFFEQRAKRIR